MSGKRKMDDKSIEEYVKCAMRDIKGYDNTIDMSYALARTIEYYSDRWNPARMEYVLMYLDRLAKRLKEEMGYDESQWRQCGLDITNDSEFEDKVHCPKCQKKILSPMVKNKKGMFYRCSDCVLFFVIEVEQEVQQ